MMDDPCRVRSLFRERGRRIGRAALVVVQPAMLLFIGACGSPGVVIDSYDERGENCAENSAPAIANIELDSADSVNFEGSEDVGWLLALHFDWQDPNPADNADPQNMVSGLVSINLLDRLYGGFWIDEETLKDGCRSTIDACPFLGFGAGSTGCSGATAYDCTDGQITVVLYGASTPIEEFTPIFYELRVRDACGAVSSVKTNYETGPYVLGSGRVEVPDPNESEEGSDSDDDDSDDSGDGSR